MACAVATRKLKMLPVLERVGLFVLIICICTINGHMMVGLDMPPELVNCYRELGNQTIRNEATGNYTNKGATPGETIDTICLQQFLWKTDRVRWSGFNVTEDDIKFINSLIPSVVHRRTKRQAVGGGGSIFPQTGYRIRREYRRLSDMERMAFHTAVNALKRSGVYDTFANLHQGIVVTSAHNGPNFFGWHRVYCALIEEALRRVIPGISLPYWDSSLDFDMDNPVNSVIWSPLFFGNGDGFVTSGPFANWQTPTGQLTRNIAAGSQLMSKEAIRRVLTRCRTSEISNPTAQPQFNLELQHGGPHVWVGGQMSGLNTAAHDPVFFLHHSFIDYLWELFRRRQRACGVNPNRDYPAAIGQHAPQRLMDGFPDYRNVDGYQGHWTRFWYRYERSPTCYRWRPFCGSMYLRCDIMRQRCVSVQQMVLTTGGRGVEALGRAVGGAVRGMGPMTTFAAANSNSLSAARGRVQAATINVGPTFMAPPSDGRTQLDTVM